MLDKTFAVALVSQFTSKGEVSNANDAAVVPLIEILLKVNAGLPSRSNGNSTLSSSRNTLLTTLRLLSNAFSYEGAGKYLLSVSSGTSPRTSPRTLLTTTLVSTLLHEDQVVRTASASLAFNIASCIQETRRNGIKTNRESNGDVMDMEEDFDWEIEILSAIVEAVKLEDVNEDTGEYPPEDSVQMHTIVNEPVHRLIASLGLLLYLSPSWTAVVGDFVQVLGVAAVLQEKISKGIVRKSEVVKLVRNVIEICQPVVE